MLFVPLGATDVIGASCHYLQIDGTGLMLDVGHDPEADGVAGLPDFARLKEHPDWRLDHALVTHAHHDHLGSLPVMLQYFPHARVHMTPATQRLAELLLPASAKLQKRRVAEGSPHAPTFTPEQAEEASFVYLPHPLDEPFDLSGLRAASPITGTFYHAGHVLGAAGVLIEAERPDGTFRVFYTSDTSLRPQSIEPGGEYPEPPIDVLILEATLGADPDAERTTRKTEIKKFIEAVATTLDRGGTVLIPVFALGRAQNIVAVLDQAKRRGLIPDEIPIYTTGSMRAVADIYDKTRHNTPRLDPDFEVFGVPQKRLPRSAERVQQALSEPSIHVASSGMMFRKTLSNKLARHLIEDEKNSVLFVGYAKPGSPAAELQEAAMQDAGEVELDPNWGPQRVRCDVGRFRFSGHSHRRDLIQVVAQTKPKRVVLVHAETAAREWMADNIRFFHPDVEVLCPDNGDVLEIADGVAV